MDIFRKIMLAVSCTAFAVCSLFLNVLGGVALMSNNYRECGLCLILSAVAFAASMLTAFFRKGIFNIISVIFNIIGSFLYIYPIGVLNAIPNSQVPKDAVEILTGRIYPSIILTVALACVIFADVFSYDRVAARAEKKRIKNQIDNRPLNDSEKIV